METYNERAIGQLGLPTRFVQDNQSVSVEGVIRGLHYQIKNPQGKLVRVTRGSVFDVAVDLRRSSPNFGKHVGVTLTAESGEMLWIPEGYAHGFAALDTEVTFTYKTTNFYSPEHERTLLWNDPALQIQWPFCDKNAILSKKDRQGLPIDIVECFE